MSRTKIVFTNTYLIFGTISRIFARGLYELELVFKVAGEQNRSFKQEFVVEDPLP